MKTYDIYLVPNGHLRDFDLCHFGTGYPVYCECWGYDMEIDELRERYRELADENFRRDDGEYDRIWDECAKAHPDQEGFSEPEIACEKYLNELTADPDPLKWPWIEWHNDLKWVRVREHKEA